MKIDIFLAQLISCEDDIIFLESAKPIQKNLKSTYIFTLHIIVQLGPSWSSRAKLWFWTKDEH